MNLRLSSITATCYEYCYAIAVSLLSITVWVQSIYVICIYVLLTNHVYTYTLYY